MDSKKFPISTPHLPLTRLIRQLNLQQFNGLLLVLLMLGQ